MKFDPNPDIGREPPPPPPPKPPGPRPVVTDDDGPTLKAMGLFFLVAGTTIAILMYFFAPTKSAQATPNDMPPGATNIVRHGPGELGWSYGHGRPAGECLPGALYSNVDGTTTLDNTLFVCEAGSWRAK